MRDHRSQQRQYPQPGLRRAACPSGPARHLTEIQGEVKLRELTAGDVQETLDMLAGRLSTRSLQITRLCLERAIQHAEVGDLVGRNVAALIKAPAGRAGRPSKSLTLEQAQDLLRAY